MKTPVRIVLLFYIRLEIKTEPTKVTFLSPFTFIPIKNVTLSGFSFDFQHATIRRGG